MPLIENANHIVQKINEIVPIVGYLTIRPKTVIEGTRIWLRKHELPEAAILARPASLPTTEGNKWKAGVLDFLYPQVLGIVDDNPAIVDHLLTDYKGTIYLFDSVEAIGGGIKVVPCRTWPDVHAQVKLLYGDT